MCAGTITTVYTWVRDHVPDPTNPGQTIPDPLDNPPDEIITVESCEVKAWVYFWILGATVNCSNGLGFPTTFDYSFGKAAESKGTLYTRRSGGQTVTLTCSPSALAVSDEPDAWVELIYQSGIIVPKVDLVGTTRFYSPHHAIKFLTGQQITGGVGAAVAGPFPMPAIGARLWSVDNGDPNYEGAPPNIFKSFTHTNALGQVNPHTASDKTQQTFSFYTGEAGLLLAKCDLTFTLPAGSKFEGGLPAFTAKSKVIKAVKPVLDAGSPADGQVFLTSTAVIFGNPAAVPGQQWASVGITVPAEFGSVGQGCFVQLISANRNMYRNTQQGYYSHFVYQRTNALDTAFPYPYQSGAWNVTGKGEFVDSPAINLLWNPGDSGGTDWYSVDANDSFKVWLMYKPPAVGGQAAEWVPISSYLWSWSGAADKQGGLWALTQGSGSSQGVKDAESDFPQWQQFSPSPFNLVGVP